MSKNKEVVKEDGFEAVESALSKTEVYIEENRKSLTIIILAILAVVVIYLLYQRYYLKPKEDEAQANMYMAERYFQQDSFLLALEGDGQDLGLLDIIDDFGATRSANLARYYAGISCLRLGQFEEAIEHLEKFDGNDRLVAPIALGATGDAYVELGEYQKGVSYYEKAANYTKNELTTPIYLLKAGMVYEEMNEFKKALDSYEKIATNFPSSNEAKEIDKYITAVKMKL